MNCREFVEFLIEYYEGKLPEEQRATFESHMAECPPCVNYLESYKQAIVLGKTVCKCEEDAIPASVPDGIVKAILDARKSSA